MLCSILQNLRDENHMHCHKFVHFVLRRSAHAITIAILSVCPGPVSPPQSAGVLPYPGVELINTTSLLLHLYVQLNFTVDNTTQY